MDFPMSLLFWYPLQRFAILVPFLVCSIFQCCGFPSPLLFFTTLILVFSSILLTISSYQPGRVHEHLSSCQICPPQLESEPTDTKPATLTQKGGMGHTHGYSVSSLDSVSKSGSLSDLDMGQGQSPDYFSDWSISDEDSFIEIALPSGRYFDQKRQLQSFPEYIFNQHGHMEVFGDMGETYDEDNLFEIDISMGSVKCC